MNHFFTRFSTVWETVQVELQGSYSLQRFEELLSHAKTSSKLRMAATILLAPVPTLIVLVLLDALPIESPQVGLLKQTPWFFARIFTVFILPPLVFPHNMHICNPELTLSSTRLALIGIIMAIVGLVSFIALGTMWAFPTPFGFQLSVFPAIPIAFGLLYWTWKDQIQGNSDVKAKAACYAKALMAQANLLSAYTAYYCAFTLAGKTYQPFASFVLPILKMIFKNSIRKGLYYVEDLAPVMIVCNIDAFHAMFVSTSIQQSEGVTTIVFIMLVDFVQSLVAYYEVVTIIRQVNLLATERRDADRYSSTKTEPAHSFSRTMSRLASLLKFEYGVIDYAKYLIDNNPRIRNHPTVALPRHMREERQEGIIQPRLSDTASVGSRIHPTNSHVGYSTPSISVLPRQGSLRTMNPARPEELSNVDRSQLQCVSRILKMLHMIEFYMLIEYVEVAISTVYSLYVMAIMHMPNRVYYKQFSSLSDDVVHSPVKHIAVYAMLELLSFTIFVLLIDQQLQHISSLQQLAFVLQRESKIVVPTLVCFAMLVVQFTFEHNGFDFTFRFEWMKQP